MTFPPTESNELQTLFAASFVDEAPQNVFSELVRHWLCCYQFSAVADLDLRFICVNLGLSSGSSIWLKSQQHPITPFSFPAF